MKKPKHLLEVLDGLWPHVRVEVIVDAACIVLGLDHMVLSDEHVRLQVDDEFLGEAAATSFLSPGLMMFSQDLQYSLLVFLFTSSTPYERSIFCEGYLLNFLVSCTHTHAHPHAHTSLSPSLSLSLVGRFRKVRTYEWSVLTLSLTGTP